MTEAEMEACLEEGDLVTESQARAVTMAYAMGRRAALAEVIEELATMDCSLSARDAAVDLRQTYASILESEPREQ